MYAAMLCYAKTQTSLARLAGVSVITSILYVCSLAHKKKKRRKLLSCHDHHHRPCIGSFVKRREEKKIIHPVGLSSEAQAATDIRSTSECQEIE
jgi:hypothetical protein